MTASLSLGSWSMPTGAPKRRLGISRLSTKKSSARNMFPPVTPSSSREMNGMLCESSEYISALAGSTPTTAPFLTKMQTSSARTVSWVIIRMFWSGHL